MLSSEPLESDLDVVGQVQIKLRLGLQTAEMAFGLLFGLKPPRNHARKGGSRPLLRQLSCTAPECDVLGRLCVVRQRPPPLLAMDPKGLGPGKSAAGTS